MQTNKLFNLERLSYSRTRNKEGIYLDGNEKADIWSRHHFDNIYNSIQDYEFNFYPDDSFDFLHQKISIHFDVSKSNFIEGLGSDYLIRDFLVMFNNQAREQNVITMDLGYGMYSVYTKGLNYNLSYFDFKLDTSKEQIYSTNKDILMNQINENDIIIITNPNQISNYDFSFEDIEKLCYEYPQKVFLIDEAYYGYGGFSTLPLIKKYKNIFVLRSFSKEMGLASLRFGLLFGNFQSIRYFKNISSVYNTSIFTAKTIEYFLDNYHLIEEHQNNLIIGREYLFSSLKEKGYNAFSTNSMSVFIFFESEDKANIIYEYLKDNNIYTKNYSGIKAIRITAGPIKLMEKVIATLDYNYDYFIKLYQQKGYFLVKNLFSKDEIFKINNIYNLEKNYDKYEKNIYCGKILRLEKFLKNNQKIKFMIENKISNFLKKLLGKEWQLFKDKVIEKHPNSKNELKLHYDGIFKTYNYRLKKEILGWWGYSDIFTNVNIMLTENNIENGALQISENNYQQTDKDLKYIIDNGIVDKTSGFIIKDIEAIKKNCDLICGNEGSVLFFNPLCAHFSEDNKSNNIRRNIYLTYCNNNKENIYDLYNNDKDLLIKNVTKTEFEKKYLSEDHF